jgi:hypothetical protein
MKLTYGMGNGMIEVVEVVEQAMGLICVVNDLHVYTITCYNRA